RRAAGARFVVPGDQHDRRRALHVARSKGSAHVTALDIEVGLETLAARPGLPKRLPRDVAVWVSGIVLMAIALAAIFAPLLAPYDPYETGQPPFIPPSFMEGGMQQFWLGTDNQGRDL